MIETQTLSEETKTYSHIVETADIAAFHGKIVHEVYATFSATRDAEWVCRLFVLDMKKEDEEGIGTFVNIKHHAPARVGDCVIFKATIDAIINQEIICKFEAYCGETLIVSGTTGQRIINKSKLKTLFA